MSKIKRVRSAIEGGQYMEIDGDTGYSYSNPTFVGIETTTRCNLDCVMCGRHYSKSTGFEFGDMDIGTFKNIVPMIKTSKLAFLSKFGEPLMAENIMEMIKICRGFDCKIAMASNGSLMDESISAQLIDNGLDWIELSIDGIESFYKIRGFELDILVNNIKKLNEIKKQKKKPNPSITFTFVAMKDNLKELPGVVRLAGSLGVNRIFVHPARIYYSRLKGQNIYNDQEEAVKILAVCKEEAAKLGISLVARQMAFIKDEGDLISSECYCMAPFDRLFVDRKGFVNEICCGLRRLSEDSGKINVNDMPIEKIWNSEEYRKIRLEFLDKNPAAICKNCNFILGTYENQVTLLGNGEGFSFLMKKIIKIFKKLLNRFRL